MVDRKRSAVIDFLSNLPVVGRCNTVNYIYTRLLALLSTPSCQVSRAAPACRDQCPGWMQRCMQNFPGWFPKNWGKVRTTKDYRQRLPLSSIVWIKVHEDVSEELEAALFPSNCQIRWLTAANHQSKTRNSNKGEEAEHCRKIIMDEIKWDFQTVFKL